MNNQAPALVVETKDLVKLYGGADGVRALDGVSLSVRAGEFVAIIGPSGSGKSTLMHMLGALDRPTRGEVRINGTLLTQVRDMDRFRNQAIGFVFQMHNLIPTLTARENIEVPMQETRTSGRVRRARAEELLALVGLARRASFLPNQMSGGERQRVAIARALANRPALVLADEPTGNLDSQTTAEIMALLLDLNRAHGVTLVIVTHNTQVARVARRVVSFQDGRIRRDVELTRAFEGDLLELRHSALGAAVLQGDDSALPEDVRAAAPALRVLLEKL